MATSNYGTNLSQDFIDSIKTAPAGAEVVGGYDESGVPNNLQQVVTLPNGSQVVAMYDSSGNLFQITPNVTLDQASLGNNKVAAWNSSGSWDPVTQQSSGGLFGSGDGILGTGLNVSDLAKVAALYYGGTALADYLGSGALSAGGEGEALSGLDLGGVGASPNTWLGEGVYGTVPAAAGATGALATGGTAATGSVPAEAAVTGAGTGVGTGALTSGLTGTQIANLAKAGITAAGLLGGAKAVSNITGGGGTGGISLPTQNRAGISSGSANYSPEYYQAIQAKYNQMMPQQPRDVTTELKNWYETKFAPKVTQ